MKYIQLHVLTAYGPSNLNRDDLGKPKTAIVGGTKRLRISSQCLKRTWRTSEIFQKELGEHLSVRTKLIGNKIYDQLINNGHEKEEAKTITEAIVQNFGKLIKNELRIEQIVSFNPAEMRKIKSITGELEKDTQIFETENAVDTSLFGRMLSGSPNYDVEASVQVSHAITTHPMEEEIDFFTAVDDLSEKGSGHIGETEYGSGLFYQYICIDVELLKRNLKNDGLTNKSIQALIKAICTESPKGKQNSFGSRSFASYVLADINDEQPFSLANGFFKSVDNYGDILEKSINTLQETRTKYRKAYFNTETDNSYILSVEEGKGNLKELCEFLEVK